jgi:hypothetical protein
MFSVGTKIRLVASSCDKQTGPKRGSMGYVASYSDGSYVDESRGMVIGVGSVMFFRYGFEQRTRLEQKEVAFVFPIVNRNKGDFHPQVTRIKDLINGRGNSDIIDQLRSTVTMKSQMPVVLAAPVTANDQSLLDCPDNEFKAWVSSHLVSGSFGMYIHGALMSMHFTQANHEQLANKTTWESFRNMAMDRDYRLMALDEWVNRRNEVIGIFQMIIAMAGRKENKNLVDNHTQHIIMRSGKMGTQDLYNTLALSLLNKPIMDNIRDILGHSKGLAGVISVIEDIETVRGELLVLSARMERKYSNMCK